MLAGLRGVAEVNWEDFNYSPKKTVGIEVAGGQTQANHPVEAYLLELFDQALNKMLATESQN